MTDREVPESVGIPFHTARHILTNAIYVGRQQDGSAARVEPVIDQATWDRM
jgi:hypothetical protein